MSAAPMSTTDIAPETVADVPAGAAADDARGGALAALAAWLTSSDSKVIGRNFIGCSLLALVGAAVLGVMLGAERIDGGDTLFDADALPQMFVAFRVALVFGVLVPLLLGIAVAAVPLQVGARSLAFPRLAAAGFWAWFSGLVLVIVALANNGGPGGGDEDMVDLFIAALGLLVIGLAAAAAPRGGDRADDAGARHAHGSRAVLRLVRARRLDRVPAGAAGAARRAHLPVRRPPLRPRPVRRQLRRRGVDRLRPHPARHVPVRPAGRRHRRRAVAGHVPQAHAAARRRVRRPRPGRCRGTLRRHPAGQPRPAVGRQRRRPRRVRRQGLRPRALRLVHPPAAARRGDRDARRRHRRPPAGQPRDVGPAEVHAGVPLRLLRCRDDLRRHARRRARPDHRPRPAGHRVRGGRRRLRRLRRRARRPRRTGVVAAEVVGPGTPERPGQRPRPARRAGDDPRLAAVLRRRVRRPAGGVGTSTTTAARPRCGTSSSPSGTS